MPCCTLRSDFEQGLVDLVEHEQPAFDHIVSETTAWLILCRSPILL